MVLRHFTTFRAVVPGVSSTRADTWRGYLRSAVTSPRQGARGRAASGDPPTSRPASERSAAVSRPTGALHRSLQRALATAPPTLPSHWRRTSPPPIPFRSSTSQHSRAPRRHGRLRPLALASTVDTLSQSDTLAPFAVRATATQLGSRRRRSPGPCPVAYGPGARSRRWRWRAHTSHRCRSATSRG